MNDERLMRILVSPHVSEKSTRVADKYNQVVFRVVPDARKPEIKRAVEKLFNVDVLHVANRELSGKGQGPSPHEGKASELEEGLPSPRGRTGHRFSRWRVLKTRGVPSCRGKERTQ